MIAHQARLSPANIGGQSIPPSLYIDRLGAGISGIWVYLPRKSQSGRHLKNIPAYTRRAWRVYFGPSRGGARSRELDARARQTNQEHCQSARMVRSSGGAQRFSQVEVAQADMGGIAAEVGLDVVGEAAVT